MKKETNDKIKKGLTEDLLYFSEVLAIVGSIF